MVLTVISAMKGAPYYAQITIPAASSGTKRQRLALGLHTTAEVRLGAHLLPNPLLPWPSRTRPDRPFERVHWTDADDPLSPRCRPQLAPMTGPQHACTAIEPSSTSLKIFPASSHSSRIPVVNTLMCRAPIPESDRLRAARSESRLEQAGSKKRAASQFQTEDWASSSSLPTSATGVVPNNPSALCASWAGSRMKLGLGGPSAQPQSAAALQLHSTRHRPWASLRSRLKHDTFSVVLATRSLNHQATSCTGLRRGLRTRCASIRPLGYLCQSLPWRRIFTALRTSARTARRRALCLCGQCPYRCRLCL